MKVANDMASTSTVPDTAAADADAAATTTAAADASAADAAPLSKSARKRQQKLETLEARKEKKKAERKKRRELGKQKALEEAEAEEEGEDTSSPPDADPARELGGPAHHAAAWAFWRRIGQPRLVLAPMVNQSELAFRMLARQYGAELCYTPMLHSTLFAQEEVYRRDNFDPHAADRPLVAQFCGDDPATLLAAARHVQGRCDAVDLNLGCPQAIARKGHYGAFLLPERDLVVSLVRALAGGLSVPVTAKIRLLPGDIDETISLALALQEAGCSVLTVHGRTREQKCSCTCDWAAIAKVKAALSIPVIANGGVEHPADIGRLLAATGCDGAMLSEAALENPAIFGGAPVSRAGQIGIARAYLARARDHPPRSSSILKAHLFKVLFMALDRHRALRERLGAASDVDDALAVVDAVEAAERAAEADETAEGDGLGLTWYRRHRAGDAQPSEGGAA